jgi:CHAT domain-containing protein
LPTEPTELDADGEILFEGYKTVPWLARRLAVSYLPSVASLTTLRGLPNGAETRRAFVGFGDPFFSPQQAAATVELPGETVLASRGILATRGRQVQLRGLADLRNFESADLAMLPRLPDTAEEVRSIALALNADLTRDVFLGKAANEQTIKSMSLSGYRVLAFATHGLVPGDLNGLTQPALAFSDPNVAGVEGDGLLTMGEILGLELDADWVVLSACNTAAAQGAGAEAVSGLGRAFFYAGTRALLVSNWPVETTSAKALTTDIFRRQAEDPSLSRAQALRQAMLGLKDGPGYVDDQGRTVFSYAHPVFWAPFTLIGDGGGAAPES